MLSHPPVPISEFAAHVARLKAGDAALFAAEYESIDPGQQFTWESSSLDANKPRNRYANVIAYDHSRVRLQPLDGVASSDYINANYLDGYCRSNAYIATQARAVIAKCHYTDPTGPVRTRTDPHGPARTLSETRTGPTEFLGDPGRKKVRACPVGSGRARVVEFSYYSAHDRLAR